jgi:hypothetical protein
MSEAAAEMPISDARDQLADALDPPVRRRVATCIDELAAEPGPPGVIEVCSIRLLVLVDAFDAPTTRCIGRSASVIWLQACRFRAVRPT